MFILSEWLILFSLKGVGHIVIWQVRLHSELGVCGGTWQSSPCQWCRGWRESSQTCSGSLASLWRQTGLITDEATFTCTQVLTKIVLAHWEVGMLHTVWSYGMFFLWKSPSSFRSDLAALPVKSYPSFAFKLLSALQGQIAVTGSQLLSFMKLIQDAQWLAHCRK